MGMRIFLVILSVIIFSFSLPSYVFAYTPYSSATTLSFQNLHIQWGNVIYGNVTIHVNDPGEVGHYVSNQVRLDGHLIQGSANIMSLNPGDTTMITANITSTGTHRLSAVLYDAPTGIIISNIINETVNVNLANQSLIFGLKSDNPQLINAPKCDGLTDDTIAIQKAVDSGYLILPYGTCKITNTIQIGDATNTESTINDIMIQGKGDEMGRVDATNNHGTQLVWYGSPGGIMMKVNGPIYDVRISDIALNGQNLASTGLKITQATASEFNRIAVSKFTQTGFVLTANPNSQNVGYGNCGNTFNHIMTTPSSAIYPTTGLVLNGSWNNNLDSCRNIFIEPELAYSGSTGTYGAIINFADNNQFIGGMFTPLSNNGGAGIFFKQIGSFPLENTFYGTAIIGGIKGASGYGNALLPYPTSDSEPVPSISNIHYLLFNGCYDKSCSFANYQPPLAQPVTQPTAPTVPYTPYSSATTLSFQNLHIQWGNVIYGNVTIHVNDPGEVGHYVSNQVRLDGHLIQGSANIMSLNPGDTTMITANITSTGTHRLSAVLYDAPTGIIISNIINETVNVNLANQSLSLSP